MAYVTVDWASTANVSSFNGTIVIDGHTLANGDLVLLKDQTTKSENGVYKYDTSQSPDLARPSDYDTSSELQGVFAFVENGPTNANRIWQLATEDPTLGTTDLEFVEVSAPAVHNVVSLGADATGADATATTTAIRNAIWQAEGGGGVVYFPPGEYAIEGTLTVSESVRLEGSVSANSNVGTTIKAQDPSGGSFSGAMIDADAAGHIQIVNVVLDCDSKAAGGIRLDGATGVTSLLENVVVRDPSGDGIVADECQASLWNRVTVESTRNGTIAGHGVKLTDCNALTIAGLVISKGDPSYQVGKAGIYIQGINNAGNVQLKNCNVEGHWERAYCIEGTQSLVTLDGCRSEEFLPQGLTPPADDDGLGMDHLHVSTASGGRQCTGVVLRNCYGSGNGRSDANEETVRMITTTALRDTSEGTGTEWIGSTQSRIAQKFVLSSATRIGAVLAKQRKTDSGNVLQTTVQIETHDSGNDDPSGTVAGGGVLKNTATYTWDDVSTAGEGTPVAFGFDNDATAELAAGTYWIVFLRQGGVAQFEGGTGGTNNVRYYKGASLGWVTQGTVTDTFHAVGMPNRFARISDAYDVVVDGCRAASADANQTWTEVQLEGSSKDCRVVNNGYLSTTAPYPVSVNDLSDGANEAKPRRQTYRDGAPTSGQGTWRQGDRVHNLMASAGGPAAWVCTASGSPGTWQPIQLSSAPSTHSGTSDYDIDVDTAGTTVQLSGSVTIRELQNGFDGQTIALHANGTGITVEDQSGGGSRNIYLRGGSDYAMSQNDILTLRRISSAWYELARTAS